MSSTLPPEVIHAVQAGVLNKYFIVAAEAILFYDFFLMLPMEIQHIWMTKWGIGNTLYVFTRYLAFIEATLMVNFAFNTAFARSPNAQQLCENFYTAGCWFNLAGIFTACNILYLRTAAVWGWTRKALFCVILTNLIIVPTACYGIQSFIKSMKYSPSQFPTIFPCNVNPSKSELYLDFIEVLVIETTVLFLTVYKRYTSWPENPTPLLRTLYRDAVLFFACLCVVSIANLVLFTTPGLIEYYQLLVQFQSASHSITTARIILHLRITGSKAGSNDGSVLLSREYMPKPTFRPPSSSEGTGNTRLTGYSSDTSGVLYESVELETRSQREERKREEMKNFLVVDPYMI